MKTTLLAIVAVLAFVIGNFTLYTVDEAEQAIVVQFGEPIGDVINEPGLKFKLPWQNVRYFDKRLLVWGGGNIPGQPAGHRRPGQGRHRQKPFADHR